MMTNRIITLARKVAPKPLERIHFAVDNIALAAAGCVALAQSTHEATPLALVAAILAPVFVWVPAVYALHHYHRGKAYGIAADLVLTTALLVCISAAWFALWFLAPSYSALETSANFVRIAFPAILSLRLAFWSLRTVAKAPPANTIVVGSGEFAQSTMRKLARNDDFNLLGTVVFEDDEATGDTLGVVHDLPSIITTHAIGKVYIAPDSDNPLPVVHQVAETCAAFGVSFALPPHVSVRDFDDVRKVDGYLDTFTHYHLFNHKPVQSFIKRLMDIVAVSFALLALSPLLLTVAALIKLTSKGPVLFKQERAGLHGRRLHMLKFRSMVVNAEELKATLLASNEQTGPVFKMQRDPRVTPIGRFIRKHSIDELPQLINILRGEMTIVGPRPAVVAEVAQYEPWHRKRLSVVPGLTCTWQVSGRNQIPFERWMEMDIEYITSWSLGQDIALILRTFPVVFTGRGAS